MKRKIISVLLASVLMLTIIIPTALAATSAEQKKKDLENKLNEAKDQKNEVSNEKNSVLDEISDLTVKISNYETQISELNTKIKKLQKDITDNEKQIEKLEEESKQKQETLIQRLVAMYEAGQTTYLDALLSSESFTGFISNYYMMSELAEADQAVIDAIEDKQKQIEETKINLEKQKRELSTSRNEIETKSNSLSLAKQSKQVKVNELSTQEKELQAKIDSFNAAIKEAQKQIDEEARQAMSNGGGYKGSFKGVLSWPLSSSSPYYNYITSIFGKRDISLAGASKNHGAVDIAVTYQPVYAPADGKVIIARSLSGYGNYILIDHGNGYYTGFGHLSAYAVSKGQEVKRGQKIATSGDTGISSGPHLHYEVHIGGYQQSNRVDPLQYTTHGTLQYAPWI